ncbi:chaperonin 10-like protein, partial [Mycena capillaripes]
FVLGPNEVPSPAKGEVLLKIMTVALNPANWIQREYNILIPEYPAILGNDLAGVIEALGEGVEGFKKGDKVYVGIFGKASGGGFRQYTTVPAGNLMLVRLYSYPNNKCH